MILIEYPKCSTCKKAKKFLLDNNVEFTTRDIVLDKLNEEEIDKFIKLSKKDVNKFFNTSGIKYRELNLKEKIKNITYEEKIKILSSDGMLIKRPLLIKDDTVLIGFKENEWKENI
ncbi:MAG: Spx/MgsR family RNA polymerase-binding regulatory protein [Candidatus Coprovivens sp.]